MQYFALVEDWPHESMVFFRELPGCFTSAPTYEEAVKAAPAAIADYLQWLKKNDIPMETDGEISVVVKERLSAINGQKGPRFEADVAPPDDIEMDNALNIAAVARANIFELYEDVPPEYHNQSTSTDKWSLADHLKHLVEAEAWYSSRLMDSPPANPVAHLPADPAMALFENAMDIEQFLRGLSPEERGRIFVHDGEEWTAAKVLRRMTEHLREHYPCMVKRASALPPVNHR